MLERLEDKPCWFYLEQLNLMCMSYVTLGVPIAWYKYESTAHHTSVVAEGVGSGIKCNRK